MLNIDDVDIRRPSELRSMVGRMRGAYTTALEGRIMEEVVATAGDAQMAETLL